VKVSYLAAVLLLIGCAHEQALAFRDGSIALGLGLFSENVYNETAQKADGSSGFLGESSYPLLLKADWAFSSTWFISPQLTYNLVPRETAGKTADVTLLHLSLQFGQNFGSDADSTFDWHFGFGFLNREIDGKGGTKQLNNGTGTATFALPGRKSTIRTITTNLGTSFAWHQSRFGLDLIFESFLAKGSEQRTQNLMFSYAYQFGGGN